MRKYLTWASVALILIVLPVGSFIYLKRGFDFQKKNFAEMQMLGAMPYDSLVNWDPGLNAVWLSGDVHVVAFFTPGNRIDMGNTLVTLQEQYAKVSHFQLIGMADNIDAMPELATYKIVSSNPNLPSIRSRFPTNFGPDVLTLVDSKDEIRGMYHWRDAEEMKKMVTHIALLLPKNE
ncbi:MAG: hypothetical protein KDC28_18295 [Saprospiraceae bacterium]|nr:hypothetical protein [Saprospiraceae bacterium]MCB9318540.1 hypothetical protein [Lewinellaceae bacterium]